MNIDEIAEKIINKDKERKTIDEWQQWEEEQRRTEKITYEEYLRRQNIFPLSPRPLY